MYKNNEKSWNRNTHICVDLKTILRNDACMKAGKGYLGVLRRDEICEEFRCEEHFTFREETLAPAFCKRNPQIFRGEFITITRRNDGTYRPNFKPMKTDKCFSVERYAFGVYRELYKALKGLVGEKR